MYDAFISYRRKNGFPIAKMIRELLKAKGITAYMDLDELTNGTFDDKLLAAIRECPFFLLILPEGALDRCHEKDDWLTREIVEAVRSGRNIIPVICDGFTFPKVWPEGVPEEVMKIASYHGIEMSYAYVNAMIDRIFEEIRGIGAGSAQSDLDTFFRNRMQDLSSIKGIDLAFHSGSTWHESDERLDILQDLAEAGIPLRILVNSPETAELLGKHMRHKRKRYMSFSDAIACWQEFANMYENVTVRVSDIPLLRVHYAFTMENEEESAVRVKYYTYGNSKLDKNYAQNFEPKDAYYQLYKEEFQFLWDRAI